ncbi:putative protein phosphatase 2C 52 [Acorus calamus]|uniref:protein-serine/threonine phosphatase n=1 Tax=Acorus calamus TaxID=4465 RepID=A0AAV9E9T6_ACOCL|nr:putative protein phosphatase 2C 52 [Acorus calamus]KAK1309098.1 putative protein phosphatase 2C 52 [Acorus calamus]
MGSCVSCCRLGMFKRRKRKTGDKRMIISSLQKETITLQQLPSLPNRIFSNGKSLTSSLFTQQGRKGINQDAMVVWEDFISEGTVFCGVFDGHGPQGHLVARKVRDALPLKLLSYVQSCEAGVDGLTGWSCFKRKERGSFDVEEFPSATECPMFSLWREAFIRSYKTMDKDLRSHSSLDCFCSGSTAITLVKQGSNLFMGYIGDSRAVLGSKSEDGDSMVAVQLTVDLKPDLPKEAERIRRCKGRVFALQDEPEVQRVWLPFDDAPGLAMARAFGDFCLKDYGVISVPEFSHRVLTERDQFIVLASDGIWDVLSNKEVVEIVSSSPARSSAAQMLVDAAVREWKLKYPTSKTDDCAVICFYLDGKMDSEMDVDESDIFSATNQNHASCPTELNDTQDPEPFLQRNFTVRSGDGSKLFSGVPAGSEGNACTVAEDQDWSGLDGVTRVNSLVQLPRFTDEKLNS